MLEFPEIGNSNAERNKLGDDSSPGCTRNTKMEYKNENRIENGIDDRTCHHTDHRIFWRSVGHGDMGQYIHYYDKRNAKICDPCILKRVVQYIVCSPKGHQHWTQKNEYENSIEKSECHCRGHGNSNDFCSIFMSFFTKID